MFFMCAMKQRAYESHHIAKSFSRSLSIRFQLNLPPRGSNEETVQIGLTQAKLEPFSFFLQVQDSLSKPSGDKKLVLIAEDERKLFWPP